MKNEDSTITSETDFEWLKNATDDDIDLSDDPEFPPEMWNRVVHRKAGVVKSVKVRVNMYLDEDIVDYFKDKANGSGYQTLINKALRASIEAEDLEHLSAADHLTLAAADRASGS